MNSIDIKNRIKTLLSQFRKEVECSTATGTTDINVESENLLQQLLPEIYGHTDLRNLNLSEGSNFPAIDLGDDEERIAYQITSTPSIQKIKDTLQKFVNHELYTKYDRLIIYVLTEKQKTYQDKGLGEIIQGLFSFDIKNDVLDYRDLLNEISGFPEPKLRKVQEILEQQFGDESKINYESINPLDWLAQINDLWIEDFPAIKINRETLLNELLSFASRGHGVIIGGPGVGKSYLLRELHHSLDSSGTQHLLLPIDKLGDGTPETLRQELSYKGDLIKKLKSVPTSCQKSILLFDAFDAARDEQTRKRFQSLIRRAIHTLKDSWNVVVTVRTYDAMKSQELLDLFGNPDDTEYQSEEIPCRHFVIPPLNEDEIRQAFEKIPALEAIYNSASQEFKRLLAIPFNLWLLQKIIMSSQALLDFSKIYSEVQLLDMFWQRRVEGASNGEFRWSILERVARRMVVERSVTIKRSDISEALDLDTPTKQAAWNQLQSDEILAKVSSTGLRIAFSHNILFDYAVSALLIEDDSQQLEDFILEDESRPLFLRPSLTYFFTRLWYKAPDVFWDVFWHVFPSNQSVHLRLVARIIPTSVIANEARDVEQLKPILDELARGREIANEAMMWLLQSLRALEIERDSLWCSFFEQISAHLHPDFAWDLGLLSSKALDRASKTDTGINESCGQVGRQMLKWIWKKRQTGEDDWYHRLAGSWVVPLVARMYYTAPEESRALLEKVLELAQEDDFPINLLKRLTEHVDKIWEEDHEFVVSIYVTVFSHQEISDEMTNPMGGRILALTSTRRQDYSMCHYWLAEHFPNFLRAKPTAATRAVIRSLNFYIIHTQILNHSRESVELETDMESFEFRDTTSYLLPDNSHIWDEREVLDEPMKMADTLFEYISELVESEAPLQILDSLLDVFRDEVWAAFFWKRLLNMAVRFPEVLAPRLFELCIAKPILMNSDTLYELGEFLQVATRFFAHEQRRLMEQTIVGLLGETGKNKEYLEYLTNRLLAQIPPNFLLTPAAKKIRAHMERENNIPENRPPVSIGPVTWGRYTDEKWLEDQGVDVTTSENQELQRFFEPLDDFRSNWMNESPTEEATELILPLLQEAYTTIKSNTDAEKEVRDRLWYKLTACTAILGRVVGDYGSHLFDFCRKVLLDGATHKMPIPNSEQDAQFDSSAFSPFPRHEAVSGLLRLTGRQSDPDSEILDAIESLANDPVPSVRMVAAMELVPVYVKTPNRFWKIVNDRVTQETNYVVLEWLCVTLIQVVGVGKEEEDKTILVMGKMLRQLMAHTEKVTPPDRLIELFMWFAISREHPGARKTIEDTLLKDPIQYAHSLNRAVFWVMNEYVEPKNFETNEERATAARAISWLGDVITAASNEIHHLCSISKDRRSQDITEKLHDVYEVIDEVVMRLYFAAAHQKSSTQEPLEAPPHSLRREFYDQVKPLMQKVIEFAQDEERGVMFAKTAYYFMRLLTAFQSYNLKEVLHFAADVAQSSERYGYNLDSLAVDDVVRFVETVLADHRNEVREGEALKDLLTLLDVFAKAGWPDALRLVWRLDEVFR